MAILGLGTGSRREGVELRGGSFLDDLERTPPFFDSHRLKDGLETRHSDLGFRLAAFIPLGTLDSTVRARVMRFPPLRASHWEEGCR